MIEKKDLDEVFEAWYDHKMEPENEVLLRQHHQTLDILRSNLEKLSGPHLTKTDVKQAISKRFGQWMRENSLPSPPNKNES